jgi:hypothetical protein
MIRHSRNQLLQLLRNANAFVANGERHLDLQEARIAKQERDGRQTRESAKLFRNMRETQSLMVSHVRLLRSEIALYEYEGGEWDELFACLQEEPEPLPSNTAALFGEAYGHGGVGCLITRALLGEEQYELYRLHCGDQVRNVVSVRANAH